MTAVRFLQNNLAAATAATVTGSSYYSADYPASNALDERRWKRWRLGGLFQVVAGSNDKVYINDGADKTVTLTAGAYTTPALFAAHVQTRLNASSSNWTVTWSSTTGKFTVGRSAGAAILRFTQATAAAWSTLGYAGVVDTSVGTGTAADARRNHTSETWTVDLGMSRQVRAFAVVGASGEALPISDTATLRLRGSDTNNSTAPWTTYDEAFTVTRSDDIALCFLDGTYRYWQFEWIDQTATGGPNIELAQLYLGDYVTLATAGLDLATGFERVYVDPSERVYSESGVPFHRERTKYWSYRGLVLDYVEGSERVELERIMNELGRTVPFFISIDPGASISSDICEFTKYVLFDEDPVRAHRWSTKYGLSFAVREVVG